MQDIRAHLIELMRSLPGIGTKQSERFVTHILERGPAYAHDMAETLMRLHQSVRQCPVSYQYFETTDESERLSPIVRDKNRDDSILMIVEKDSDIVSIEKSHAYNGQYFVLGGLVPMLQTKTRSSIRIVELLNHIKDKLSKGTLSEIILGFSFTPEGDHTRLYTETKIYQILEELKVICTISALGRGMAVGSEIEYSDPSTLASALEHRLRQERNI